MFVRESDLVFVRESPDSGSNLTGEQNNQAGKELWERKKRDVYSMDRSLSMNS